MAAGPIPAAAKSPAREGIWTRVGRWKTLGSDEESLKFYKFYLSAYFDFQRAGDFVPQLLGKSINQKYF